LEGVIYEGATMRWPAIVVQLWCPVQRRWDEATLYRKEYAGVERGLSHLEEFEARPLEDCTAPSPIDSRVCSNFRQRIQMKATNYLLIACVAILLFAAQAGAQAQVAGTTTIDIANLRVEAVALGWSAKKQILGRMVYNEAGENVGKVEDLI